MEQEKGEEIQIEEVQSQNDLQNLVNEAQNNSLMGNNYSVVEHPDVVNILNIETGDQKEETMKYILPQDDEMAQQEEVQLPPDLQTPPIEDDLQPPKQPQSPPVD